MKKIAQIFVILTICMICPHSGTPSTVVTNSLTAHIPAVNSDPDAFISIWNTSVTSDKSSASNQVRLPLEESGIYDFSVDWGDNTSDSITSWDQAEVTHTYSSQGTFTIKITGTIIGWRFFVRGDCLKICEIQQWGALRVGNAGSYFSGCKNLNLTTTDRLDLTGTTTLSQAFSQCKKIGSSGNLYAWDVSHVTDMSYMFYGAFAFNQALDAWDVSSVTNMDRIFYCAFAFNQALNAWDVSSVMDMHWMFYGASSFNQSLDTWDVSHVTDMHAMFTGASSFNQPLDAWDVSHVMGMNVMFAGASSFNQPLNSWNVSSVTNMRSIFSRTSSFNQSLDTWDVSRVTNMIAMFESASSFNQPLNSWDVSSVTNMDYMFHNASAFNQALDAWDVSSVTDLGKMFQNASLFNQPLNSWDVSQVTDMGKMFQNASLFNQPLNSWDVSSVTDMRDMFNGTSLSTSNYDGMLLSWSQLPLQSGVIFGAGNAQCSAGAAATARQLIVDKFGWTIIDGDGTFLPTKTEIAGFPPVWFSMIMLGTLIGLVGNQRKRYK